MRGGKRPGAGRPPGQANKMSREARERAASTGLLPHEFLLAVSRGETVGEHTPTFEERMEAAKAAAPYYAPKLAAVDHSGEIGVRNLKDLTDDELAAIAAGGGSRIAAASGGTSKPH